MRRKTEKVSNKPAVRRLLCLLAALVLLLPAARAEEDVLTGFTAEDEEYPPAEYAFDKKDSVRYESDTLIWSIESFTLDGVLCLLTKVWVRDPARQIRKANAPWGENWGREANPRKLTAKIPGAVLSTNASGYITKAYPDLPEGYPGESSDYFNTTLGSLVVTDGEVLRNLEGVPFHGLALTDAGITLHRGTANDTVLAMDPKQTWAFFEQCVLQEGGVDTLPEQGTWELADTRYPRAVIARVNRNNYLMLHVPNRTDSSGLSLHRINTFFFTHFETEWVYNLDGGYSATLIYRQKKKNAGLTLLAPNRQQVADILCFTE